MRPDIAPPRPVLVPPLGRAVLNRRRLEAWVVAVVLTIQGGALLQLAFIGPDGTLDPSSYGRLRLLSLMAYLLAAGLLLPYRQRFLRSLRSTLPLLILIALAFASVLWSVGPSATLRRAVGLTGSLLIAYFIALRFTPTEFRRLIAITLGVYMGASLVLAGLAPRLAFMPMEPVLRGVFLSKNSLGWAAGIGAVVALTFLAERVRNPGALALLAASLACLVLSGSMTGSISLMVGIILMLFLNRMVRASRAGRAFLLLVLIQTVIFALLLLTIFLVPALEALGRDATLTGRIPLWALVDQQIAARPLLGYGYDGFWTEGNDQAWGIWGEIGWNAPHSHMGYREILLGLGLPGGIMLVWMLVRAAGQGFALLVDEPQAGWLWLNVIFGMFLVMNITESLFLAPSDLPFTLSSTAIVMFATRAATRARQG